MEPRLQRESDVKMTARKLLAMHPHLHVFFGHDQVHFHPLGELGSEKINEAQAVLKKHGFTDKDFLEPKDRQNRKLPGFYIVRYKNGNKNEKTAFSLGQELHDLKMQLLEKD